jgi:hypothetical protein
MPAQNSSDTNPTRQSTKRDRIASSGRRGGRRMMSGSAPSKASAMASTTELTMFTHRIWTGVIGSVSPSTSARISASASPPFTGSRKTTAFLRLS